MAKKLPEPQNPKTLNRPIPIDYYGLSPEEITFLNIVNTGKQVPSIKVKRKKTGRIRVSKVFSLIIII